MTNAQASSTLALAIRIGRWSLGCGVMALVAGSFLPVALGGEPEPTSDKPLESLPMVDAVINKPKTILDQSATRIDGSVEKLDVYAGKVVLIVNVASECGFTKQYAGLQKLYDKHKEAGLVILGFPSNDFNGQEPGTNAAIRTFCTERYGVTFPMFEKVSVRGAEPHPLYKRLSEQPVPIGGEPRWNFTKFVVDRAGNIVARFEPLTAPSDKDFVAKIESLLSAAAPTPAPAVPGTSSSESPAKSDTPASAVSPAALPTPAPAPTPKAK